MKNDPNSRLGFATDEILTSRGGGWFKAQLTFFWLAEAGPAPSHNFPSGDGVWNSGMKPSFRLLRISSWLLPASCVEKDLSIRRTQMSDCIISLTWERLEKVSGEEGLPAASLGTVSAKNGVVSLDTWKLSVYCKSFPYTCRMDSALIFLQWLKLAHVCIQATILHMGIRVWCHQQKFSIRSFSNKKVLKNTKYTGSNARTFQLSIKVFIITRL